MAHVLAQRFRLAAGAIALAASSCSQPPLTAPPTGSPSAAAGAADSGGAAAVATLDADAGAKLEPRPGGSGGALRDASVADAALQPSPRAETGPECPRLADPGGLSWTCSGGSKLSSLAGGYDGWATVERSATLELVVYVSPERLTADPLEPDAGQPPATSSGANPGEAARCTLSAPGLQLATYRVGSRVWLHERHDRDYGPPARLHYGDELSLRASQRGPLLLSSFQLPAAPSWLDTDALSVQVAGLLCTSSAASACLLNGRVQRLELTLLAADRANVKPGERAEIVLAGERYAFRLVDARRATGSPDAACSASAIDGFVFDDRLWVTASLLPRDGSTLGAQLPLDPL